MVLARPPALYPVSRRGAGFVRRARFALRRVVGDAAAVVRGRVGRGVVRRVRGSVQVRHCSRAGGGGTRLKARRSLTPAKLTGFRAAWPARDSGPATQQCRPARFRSGAPIAGGSWPPARAEEPLRRLGMRWSLPSYGRWSPPSYYGGTPTKGRGQRVRKEA